MGCTARWLQLAGTALALGGAGGPSPTVGDLATVSASRTATRAGRVAGLAGLLLSVSLPGAFGAHAGLCG